jgi:glycosyltransferase involved in cell wall biosynthesis
MKVVLTIAGLSRDFGGPSQSIPDLAEALAHENVGVDLLTCEAQPGQGPPALPDTNLVRTSLLPVRSRQGRWRARSNDLFRALTDAGAGADTIIHDNGLWLPTNHAVVAAARFLKRPLLISPRGMLSQWAVAHHRWKKAGAWMVFQQRDLFRASALHVTSEQELADTRRAGFRGAVAVVPNGVEVKPGGDRRSKMEDRSRLRSAISGVQSPGRSRTALFIGRVHRVKGLMNLVEAWSEVRPKGWRMVIAGSDEDGYRSEVERAVAREDLVQAFEFVGFIEGEHKQALYRNADLFVLPSYSENFGMAIAEALANELPVITTRGTPWKDLIDYGCGWWAEIGVQPLARALHEATQLGDETRRKMGERGRELVTQKYSWPQVAKKMKSVYEWLLGYGERPEYVESK